MRKGELTRAHMIEAATRLIEEQGYAATGLKQILSESDAPKGSFYFHFPGGKEELGAHVVEAYAEDFAQRLDAIFLMTDDPLAAATASLDFLGAQLVESDYASGCPVLAIAFEMANRSDPLRDATRAAFELWTHRMADRLVAAGHAPDAARSKARMLLCAIEGAIVLSRAYRDPAPFDDVKAQLPALLQP